MTMFLQFALKSRHGSFLVLPFFGGEKKTRKNTQKKQGFFIPTEALKSLEKKGKTVKKQGIPRRRKKNQQQQRQNKKSKEFKKKQGKEGHGSLLWDENSGGIFLEHRNFLGMFCFPKCKWA